jgi:hypothetical protein
MLPNLYPTHSQTLTTLDDPSFGGAYGTFLRTRIYLWVCADLGQGHPITPAEVLQWVGINKDKTRRNYASRINQGKKSLVSLRNKPDPSLEDLQNLQTLSMLVEGALVPFPAHLEDRDDDADNEAIGRALQISGARFDAINKRVNSST